MATSRLDLPGMRDSIADLAAAGLTQQDIGKSLDPPADRKTIRKYLRDPIVAQLLEKKLRERTNRMVRQVDSTLEDRIKDPVQRAKIPTRELLEIRRELQPPAQRHVVSRGQDEPSATADLYQLMAQHPDMTVAELLSHVENAEDAGERRALEEGEGDG